MRKRHAQPAPAPKLDPDFRCDPFAALTPSALGLSRNPDPPKPAAPPPKAAPPEPVLSREDRELLKAFEGATSLTFRDVAPPRSRVRIRVVRQGRGGQPCTTVRGLEGLDLSDAMALAARLREDLDCAVHVADGVFTLDGDRLAQVEEWFREHPVALP